MRSKLQSPIEFWLPEGSVNTSTACGRDMPACDTERNHTDSGFYDRLVRPLAPYTLGSMLWDQVRPLPLSCVFQCLRG